MGAVHESQAQQAAAYRAWVEQSVDAIITFDAAGRVRSWNPRAECLLGHTAEEALGQNLLELIIPHEQQNQYGSHITEALEKGRGLYLGQVSEVRLMQKNGERFSAEVSFFQTQVEDGECYFTAMIRQRPSSMHVSPELEQTLLPGANVEELLQTLADDTPYAIWVSNAKGTPIFLNLAWRKFFGNLVPDPYHIDWNHLIHPDDLPEVQTNYYAALAQQEPYRGEFRMKQHDGQYRWLYCAANPRYVYGGEFGGYIGTLMDITSRKQAEQNLQESEERFRLLADASPVFIGIYDTQGNSVFYNQTTLEYTGICMDDLKGNQWLDYVHPQDRDWMRALHYDTIAQQTGYTKEYRLLLPDGSVRHLLRMAKPRFNQDQKYIGQVCVAVDITEQKVALEKFQRISDANIIGIVRWRRDGMILESNDAFLSLTGYTRQDLQAGDINWQTLTPLEYQAMDRICWEKLSGGGSCPAYIKQLSCKDGKRVDVVVGAAGFENKPNEGMLFVLDITGRRNMERALHRTLERERARRRILEMTVEAADLAYQWGKPVDLNAVAEEVCRFYQSDRCLIISYGQSLHHAYSQALYLSGQACSSGDILPVMVDMLPENILLQHHLPLEALHQINAPNREAVYNIVREKLRRLRLSPEEVEAKLQAFIQRMQGVNRIQSLLRVGIVYRGKPYGTISLHQCSRTRHWEEDEVDLLQDIAQHIGNAFYQEELQQDEREARQALEKNYNLLNIVNEAQSYYISQAEPESLFKAMLNQLLTYTNSTFGFIGEVLHTEDQAPYLKIRCAANVDQNEDLRRWFVERQRDGWECHDLNSLFGALISSGQPVIFNHPDTDPRLSGQPDNPPPFTAFFGLPLYQGSEIVGMVGLANRPGGYPDAIVEELRSFTLSCANMVMGVRNEALRKQLTQELKTSERSLKRYAARLELSNQELEQFATIASHDLQAPLRKVALFSDFIRETAGQNLPPDCYDYIGRIQTAVAKMQMLITDLLALSRVTRMGKPFKPVDLNATAQSVLMDLEPYRQEVQGTIEIEGALTLEADETQMHQVLQNLIENALKFHEKGVSPMVQVLFRLADDSTGEIVVHDNGIGFEEKKADRIFAIFERLHGDRDYEGTGIGLAIVRKIVERHSGNIMAHSAPGQGSTFIIRLPMEQPATGEAANSMANADNIQENAEATCPDF